MFLTCSKAPRKGLSLMTWQCKLKVYIQPTIRSVVSWIP